MKKIKSLTGLSTLPILGMVVAPLTSCSGNKTDVTRWTVTFDCDEGATLSGDTTIKVDKNSKWSSIKKPKINFKDGYTSKGWYKDNQPITTDFEITSDLTIKAKTEKIPPTPTPSTNFEWEYDESNSTASVKKYNSTTCDVILPTKVTNDGKTYTVTSIGNGAFKDTKITTIKIPATIIAIGENAFSGCNLTSANFLCDEKNWTLLNNDDCLEWNVSDATKNAEALIQGANYYWHSGIGFVNDSWANIINYANQGLQVLKAKYLDRFGIESFIGLERKIEINNKIHWVRVIGEGHDTIAETNKQAALTFELVTLLSDSTGAKMTSKWDASNNYDYTNSILRANLNGTGSGARTFSSTVLSMLPPELQNGIKTVNKKVAKTSSYTPTEYSDKLFPLTYTEMSQSGSKYAKVEGTTYKYWEDHNNNEARIKKDAKGDNHNYWLVSPSTVVSYYAWHVGIVGHINDDYVDITSGVSFAFCI